MNAQIGPERIILCDGLQPFMFTTRSNAIFMQAQLRFPPGYKPPAENAYPGLPGNVISRDGGRTWAMWNYAAKPAPGNGAAPMAGSELGPTFEGCALQLSNGAIIILDWVARGPDEQGNFHGKLWESRDDMQSLEGPIPWQVNIPQGAPGRDDGGHPFPAICLHRTILELPGGELLATAYGWFKGDNTPVPYRPQMSKTRSLLLRSADRGRSWQFVSTIAVDPSVGEEGFNEPAMARVSKGPRAGRLVCLLRTGSNNCVIYQAISDDGGKTWSPAKPLPFHGLDPDLLETSDGVLVGVIGRRLNEDPNRDRGYQLIASHDAGETWTRIGSWNIEPYAGTDNTTYYAAIRELSRGRVLVVYDVGFWGTPIRYIAAREITLTQ